VLDAIKRIIRSLYIQNQFWLKLSKQHQVMIITFIWVYSDINQFTSNSFLIKINSLKLNPMKINYRRRQSKHTLKWI